MSTLISSAVSGKKAAPKAPARRRPAPAAAPPKPPPSQTTPAPPNEPDAPPSPPATQQPDQHQESVSHEDEQRERLVQPPSQPTAETAPPAETRPRPLTSVPQERQPQGVTPISFPEAPPPRPAATQVPVGELEYQLNEVVRPQSPVETHPTQPQPLPEQEAPPAIQHLEEQPSIDAADSGSRKRKEAGETAQRQSKAPTAKRQKKSSARSNATVQFHLDGEDGAIPAPENRLPLEGEPSGTNEESATDGGSAPAAKPKRRRQTKKKSAAIVTEETPPPDGQDGDEATGEETAAAAKPKRRRAPGVTKKKRRPRKRANADGGQTTDGEDPDEEESDPEAYEHDPTTVSMWDVSHDAKHGKVSDREKKMAEIDWDEVTRKRYEEAEKIRTGAQQEEEARRKEEEKERAEAEKAREREEREKGEGSEDDGDGGKKKKKGKGRKGKKKKGEGGEEIVESTEGTGGQAEDAEDDEDNAEANDDGDEAAGEEANENPPAGTAAGLQLKLVNGELQVVDESTELPATAEDHDPDAPVEEVVEEEEENDLTLRLNRMTGVNNRRRDPTERVPAWKLKSDPWGEEETDRFYEALKMFGTDFFLISKMFAPKTRKQIKLKFNREEKLDPTRITRALLGQDTRPMSLTHYANETGEDIELYTKYDSFEHANNVIKESMKDKEAQMQQAVEEEKEQARQAEVAMKQKEEAKRVQEERRAYKRNRRGKKMGTGTMGG